MSQRTASPSSISGSTIERKPSAGLKKAIRIMPILFTLKWSLFSTHCAASRASKHCCKKFSRRRRLRTIRANLRHESAQLLRRAEATQRLQGRDRLRCGRMAVDADRESDFSVLRYPQLGGAARCAPVDNRFSGGADCRLGV